MDLLLAPKIHAVNQSEIFFPAVSIIMPFEPKLRSKNILNHSLRLAVGKVQRELFQYNTGHMAHLLMQKLRSIVSNLNYSTHTISVAICVSPVFEKVLYLNMPVEEKIVVSDSFDILNLVNSKKELHKYMILVLGDKKCCIYLGQLGNLRKILSNTRESVSTNLKQVPTGISEVTTRKTLLDEYLCYNDNVLGMMLNAYRRPLFVMGSAAILSQFRNVSNHTSAIVEYVQRDYEEAHVEQLQRIITPHIADWEKVKEKYLLNQLKEAEAKNKLVIGGSDVWREASHRSRLLIVEKNYVFSSAHRSIGNVATESVARYGKFSCTKNPLDETIENVLKYGGDVELVDSNVLRRYDHIALIK